MRIEVGKDAVLRTADGVVERMDDDTSVALYFVSTINHAGQEQ